MLRIAVLCAIAVAISADGNKLECCSYEDRMNVLETWTSVWSASFSARQIIIAQEAFAILFQNAPDSKALFGAVNVQDEESDEFKAHCFRVSNGFSLWINNAYDPDVLQSILEHNGHQHSNYPGLKSEYFDIFRTAFSKVLSQSVPCFDEGAWDRCISAMQAEVTGYLPV